MKIDSMAIICLFSIVLATSITSADSREILNNSVSVYKVSDISNLLSTDSSSNDFRVFFKTNYNNRTIAYIDNNNIFTDADSFNPPEKSALYLGSTVPSGDSYAAYNLGEQIIYVTSDSGNLPVYVPYISYSDMNGPLYLYVSSDGSTYYRDSNHDGTGTVLTPEQALVPEHLARDSGSLLVCGDGLCNGEENCNNCPLDCGTCDDPKENCQTPGDEDGNYYSDCSDSACPEGIACNVEGTKSCINYECIELVERDYDLMIIPGRLRLTDDIDVDQDGNPEVIVEGNPGLLKYSDVKFYEFENGAANMVYSFNDTDWKFSIPKAIGDIDQDGLIEMIVANEDLPLRATSIYEQSDMNSYPDMLVWDWVTNQDEYNSYAEEAVIDDLDGDGLSEFSIRRQNDGDQQFAIFESHGNNNYTKTYEFIKRWEDFYKFRDFELTSDLDGDGKKEAILVGETPNTMYGEQFFVLENSGDNQFELVWNPLFTDEDYSNWEALYVYDVGDTDGDGHKEFLVGRNNFTLFENTGDNEYEMIYAHNQRYADAKIAVEDLNLDGEKEIIIAHRRLLTILNLNGADDPTILFSGEVTEGVDWDDNIINSISYGDLLGDAKKEVVFSNLTHTFIMSGLFDSGEDCASPGDEDQDGYSDCEDSDCFNHESCQSDGGTCGNGICDLGESSASCPVDCVTNANFYDFTLIDYDCLVNLTLSVTSGAITLKTNWHQNICTAEFDETITANAGETRSIILDELNAGIYYVSLEGSGDFTLTRTGFCRSDNNPPVVRLNSYPNSFNNSVLLSVNLSDLGSGLENNCQICLTLDECNWETALDSHNKGDYLGYCEYEWQTGSLPDGWYNLKFRVSDTNGNIGESTEKQILNDQESPNVHIISATTPVDTTEFIEITVNATDIGGISQVVAEIGGISYPLIEDQDAYLGTIPAPGTPGYYELTVTAIDVTGKQSIDKTNIRINEHINWSEAINLHMGVSSYSLATDTAKVKHLVYETADINSKEIYYTKISESGKILDYNLPITETIYNSANPNILVNDDIYIVWQDDRDGNKEIYFKVLNKQIEKRLTTNLFDSINPKILGYESALFVFWIDNRLGTEDLYVKKIDKTGKILIGDTKIAESVYGFELSNTEDSILVVVNEEIGDLRYLTLNAACEITKNTNLAHTQSTSSAIKNNIYVAIVDQGIQLRIYNLNGSLLYNSNITLISSAKDPYISVDDFVHIVWHDNIQGNDEIFYSKLDLNGNLLVDNYQLTHSQTNTTNARITFGSNNIFYLEDSNLYYKTDAVLENKAPQISNVVLDEISPNQAVISWDTDEPSEGVIRYGVIGSDSAAVSDDLFGNSHSLAISPLEPITNYGFLIDGTDVLGNTRSSEPGEFVTLNWRFRPVLPTVFYGIAQFDNGTLAGGIEVTAYWIDAGDENQTTKIYTVADNNSEYFGYYFYNQGEIKAKSATTIVITADNARNEPFTLASPGGSAKQVTGGPLIIDTNPPVITIDSPRPTTYHSVDLNLRYVVDEEITWAAFSLNGGDPVTITNLQNQDISFTARTEENSLTIFARDLLGKESQETVVFTVNDSTPPFVVVDPINKVHRVKRLTAQVSDSTNTLKQSCEVCITHNGNCIDQWIPATSDFSPGDSFGTCSYDWDTTSVSDGNYFINFRIRDVTDNIGTGTLIPGTVDNTAPDKIIGISVSPVEGLNALNIVYSPASAKDFSEYRIYRSKKYFTHISQASLIKTIDSIGTTFYQDTNLTEKETYYYAITVVDDIGNEDSVVESIQGMVNDITPPTISIQSPTEISYATSTITVIYQVSEPAVSCEYSLNGGENYPAKSGIEITALEGSNTIQIFCEDENENLGSSQIINFLVDTTAPEKITGLNLTILNNLNILLNWSPSIDPEFSYYRIYKSNQPFNSTTKATLIGTSGFASFTDYSTQQKNTYHYAVTAVDKLDNEDLEVVPQSIYLSDTVPPVVSIESPRSIVYNNASQQLIFSVSEETIYCNQSLNGVDSHAELESTLQGLEGSNTLILSCLDLAGNLGNSSVDFTIDTTAPQKIESLVVLTVPKNDTLSLVWDPVPGTAYYRIYRKNVSFTTVEDLEPIDTTYNFNYVDSGLDAETTYYYAVTGVDSVENENSDVISVSGIVADYMPPELISNITVTTVPKITSLDLAWTRSQAPDFAGYHIYRSESSFTKTSRAALIETISDKNKESFTDAGLLSSVTYHYAIVAFDNSGNEKQDVVSVSGTVADIIPPEIAVTSPLNRTYKTSNLLLRYQADEAVFDCEYSLNGAGYLSALDYIEVLEGTNSIQVQCIDNSGNLGQSDMTFFSIDTIAPEQVSGLTVSTVSKQASLSLQWNPSPDLDFAFYKVYRSENPITDTSLMTAIGTTMIPSFTDIGLVSEATYYYAVTAVDLIGNEDPHVFSASGTVYDLNAPDPISGLAVITVPNDASLHVSWQAGSDQDLEIYNVYQSLSPFTSISEAVWLMNTTQTSFIDTGLKSKETYYYGITGVDHNGNENPFVITKSGTVADIEPPIITISSPIDQIYDLEEVAVSYSVDEQVSSCYFVLNNEQVEENSFIIGDQNRNYLIITCEDLSGNIGNSSIGFDIDTISPARIHGLVVTPIPHQRSLSLSWDQSIDNDTVEYHVYRSKNSFNDISSLSPIAVVTIEEFTDINLVSEATYHYAVTAVDSVGNENHLVESVPGTVADAIPPQITIFEPSQEIYGSSNISVSYGANEETPVCYYSLNQEPDTILTNNSFINAEEGENILMVKCSDMADNIGSAIILFLVDLLPPNPVLGLSVTTVPKQNSLSISWNANTETDLDYYKIYRDSNPFTSVSGLEHIMNTTQTSFLDNDLISGQSYHYAVTAIDIFNNENPIVVSVEGTVADTIAPLPISGLLASSRDSEAAIDLTWDPSLDSGLSYYAIYRSLLRFENITSAALLSKSNVAAYSDLDVDDGQTYYYAVTAVDSSDNEDTSVESIPSTAKDFTAPTIFVSSLGSEVVGTVVVSAFVVDNGVGIAGCDVCIGKEGNCTWTEASLEVSAAKKNGTCSYIWDTTNFDKALYSYNFKAYDLAGNIREATAKSVEVINLSGIIEFTLGLNQGWNLISIPVMPLNRSTEAVLGGVDYNKVYSFEPHSESWLVYNPTRSDFDQANSLLQLTVGKGYWIDVNEESSLTIRGIPMVNLEMDLTPGWNLIGYPYLEEQNISSALSGVDYYRVYTYDSVFGSWDVYKPYDSVYEPNTISDMSPGVGYLIDVKSTQKWVP